MNSEVDFTELRERMVREQLRGRDITDARVLEAMRRVPRHRFVPPELQAAAYRDTPLPIGSNQTISQPYIVAYMTQLLQLQPGDVVLEIGTGSGYQTAVLCELAEFVYSLERYPKLAELASNVLDALGYENVELHIGDGSQGLPDMAPFDAILVTAAAPVIPGPLRAQLADGGRMVLPIGDDRAQILQRVRRTGDQWKIEEQIPVMFVPLYGRHGFQAPDDPEMN
ncbi:MAG: protein-L-isoaspartate(D-aspartate) O-methyltransferase, partial [Chloroflexi bacterium]|nr:protein-L-isoaspartate(D-aspartate) O-methyltransferase [Chloroflexota bacterium]